MIKLTKIYITSSLPQTCIYCNWIQKKQVCMLSNTIGCRVQDSVNWCKLSPTAWKKSVRSCALNILITLLIPSPKIHARALRWDTSLLAKITVCISWLALWQLYDGMLGHALWATQTPGGGEKLHIHSDFKQKFDVYLKSELVFFMTQHTVASVNTHCGCGLLLTWLCDIHMFLLQDGNDLPCNSSHHLYNPLGFCSWKDNTELILKLQYHTRVLFRENYSKNFTFML